MDDRTESEQILFSSPAPGESPGGPMGEGEALFWDEEATGGGGPAPPEPATGDTAGE